MNHLVFLIIFTFNFVFDSSMASSHTTTINGDLHLLGDSYLRHSIAGLTLESNLLASFSGNTTSVRFSSNRSNSSALFSFSIVNIDTFFISLENGNTGSPGGYLVLLLTKNTFLKDPNDTLVGLDMDNLNWMDTADCMDAGIDRIDYNRSQKNLKLVLLLLTPEMDLSCYFQEEETQTQSYGIQYLNTQNVTNNTFDSRIKQYELYPKLIGIGLILVFFLFYISGACIQEWNLSTGSIQFQPKAQDFDDEETLDMNENDVLLSKKRNSEFSLHEDLEGEWINHLDTLFEKYIKPRKDLQVEDDDFLEFVPREAVLQILRVVRMIIENKHFYSSYEHHLSSLLASTDADVVEACLQTLSAFLRKSSDPKLFAFAQGCGGKEEDDDEMISDLPESLHELQPAEAAVPDDTLSAAEDQSSQQESNSSMDCGSSTEDKTSSEQQLQMQSVVSTESKSGRSRWLTKAEMMAIGVHMMEDGEHNLDDDGDDDPAEAEGSFEYPSWLKRRCEYDDFDTCPSERNDPGYKCQDNLLTKKKKKKKYLPSWAWKSAAALDLPESLYELQPAEEATVPDDTLSAAEDQSSNDAVAVTVVDYSDEEVENAQDLEKICKSAKQHQVQDLYKFKPDGLADDNDDVVLGDSGDFKTNTFPEGTCCNMDEGDCSQEESNSSMDCTSSIDDKTSSEQQLQMQSVVSTGSKSGRSRWLTKAEMMEIGVHMMEDGEHNLDDDDDDEVEENAGGYDISPYESDDDGYICQDELPFKNNKDLPSWARKSAVAMALPLQQELDPETIFAAGTFCNMDTIFPAETSCNTDEVAGIQQQGNASRDSKVSKVKALEAAKARYLRQQEEETRRKLHKGKYKKELAKAKETNAKENELYEKNKQESMKKKDADENRRKKQREEEERKQKALNRKTGKQLVVPWKI